MLLSLMRLGFFGLIGLSVLYLLLSLYARSVRRETLERQWDEGDGTGEREDFVRAGMETYRHSLRRKLILLVYVVPMVAVSGLIYLINFN